MVQRGAKPVPKSILIFGGANSGKTVFAAQLFGRLQSSTSQLRLARQPDDLSLVVAGYDRLSMGYPPEHTTLTAGSDIRLEISDEDGRHYEVVYPDYGGEQADALIDTRRISEEWESRISQAAAWVLLIRLDHLSLPSDVISSPASTIYPRHSGEESSTEYGTVGRKEGHEQWSDQARLVEGLQMLLHVYGSGIRSRVRRPPLVVVLSCWDELSAPEGSVPEDLLRERLPLLSSFIRSNWEVDSAVVFGLSAQGKAIRPQEPDSDFVEKGPEGMGYVVLANGESTDDLTVILSEALRRASDPGRI